MMRKWKKSLSRSKTPTSGRSTASQVSPVTGTPTSQKVRDDDWMAGHVTPEGGGGSKNVLGMLRRAFKKKEPTGPVSEYEVKMPKEVIETIAKIEKYAADVTRLNYALLLQMQPSITGCPPAASQQQVVDTNETSTAEKILTAFQLIDATTWQSESLGKTATLALTAYDAWTREFQTKGRSVLHNMRSFIMVDLRKYLDSKTKLMDAHHSMEKAKTALDATPEVDDEKRNEYHTACKAHKEDVLKYSKELLIFADTLSARKEEHLQDVFKFFEAMNTYEMRAIESLGKMSKCGNINATASTTSTPSKKT